MSSSTIQAKSQLRSLSTRAIKRLGQHFLVDPDVLETIVSASELELADTVVEVGPGLGVLTEELVSRAGKVVAIEVDSKLAAALSQRFSNIPQLTVLNANVLDLNPCELVGNQGYKGVFANTDRHSEQSEESQDPSLSLRVTNKHSGYKVKHSDYKVIANLPYYIASPILRHFLEASLKPSLMVVMVQKEVGQSIVARPGAMSLLGISVQLYGNPTIVDYVPARSFYPQPKVDSAIVRIDVYPTPAVDVENIDGFFEVVKAGFSTPRKQLRNALSIGLQLPPAEAVEILGRAGIAPERRPQTLSLEEWAEVYRIFASRDKPI